jgi:hypothetical protein
LKFAPMHAVAQSLPSGEPKTAAQQPLFAECPMRVNRGKLSAEEHADALRLAQAAATRAAESRWAQRQSRRE